MGFAQFRHNLNFAELRKEKEPKRKEGCAFLLWHLLTNRSEFRTLSIDNSSSCLHFAFKTLHYARFYACRATAWRYEMPFARAKPRSLPRARPGLKRQAMARLPYSFFFSRKRKHLTYALTRGTHGEPRASIVSPDEQVKFTVTHGVTRRSHSRLSL